MTGEIVIFGLGGLGFSLLNFLVRTPGVKKLVASDVDGVKGKAKAAAAHFGAIAQGIYDKEVKFVKADLFNVDETAELLKEIQPDMVVNAAALGSWWVIKLLPPEESKLFYSVGSADTPFHLTLAYKLMQAVKKSGIDTHVVNCAYPDITNPMLGKIGLAPTIGGGNAQNRIPRIKQIVSDKLKVSKSNIDVFLIAEHAWTEHLSTCPMWMKIVAEGQDVTDKFPRDKLMKQLQALDDARGWGTKAVLGGWETKYVQQDVAGSYMFNILAIYFDTGAVTSAPGPDGLIGAYPVRLSRKGAEVILPPEINLKEAIKINEDGARVEGVEKITDDGTLVHTEDACKVLKKLGLDWTEFNVKDSEEIANKMRSWFEAKGVELS